MSNFLVFNDNKFFLLLIFFSVLQLFFDIFFDNKKTNLLLFVFNGFLISICAVFAFNKPVVFDLLKIENSIFIGFGVGKSDLFLMGILILLNFVFRFFLEHSNNLLHNKHHKKIVIFLNISFVLNLLILSSNNLFTNLIFISLLAFFINIFVDETVLKSARNNFQISNLIFYFQNFIFFIIVVYSIKYRIGGNNVTIDKPFFQDNYEKYQLLFFLVFCYLFLSLFVAFYYYLTKNKTNLIGDFLIIFFGYLIPILLVLYKISFFNFLIENYSSLVLHYSNFNNYLMIFVVLLTSLMLLKNIFSEKFLLIFLFQSFFYHIFLYHLMASYNSDLSLFVIMSFTLNVILLAINYLSFFYYLKLSNTTTDLKKLSNLPLVMPVNAVFLCCSLLSNIGFFLSPTIVLNYSLYKIITLEKQYSLLIIFTINFITYAIIFILYFKSFINYKNLSKDSFDRIIIRKLELDYLAILSKILPVIAMITVLFFRKHLYIML